MKKLHGVRKIFTITPQQDEYLRHCANSLQISVTEYLRRLIDLQIKRRVTNNETKVESDRQ